MVVKERIYVTGKRKESQARLWMEPGKGRIEVNGKSLLDYFGRDTLVMHIQRPLEVTNTLRSFDFQGKVKGGGKSGQAGALRLAIARSLVKINEEYNPILRREGLLTRDPRIKERKKYGLAKARKRYQFSKR